MNNVICGNIIDIHNRRTYKGCIHIEGKRIVKISESTDNQCDRYILPGFVDAHVHVESSMLGPTEFGRLALPHGTVATVSDPHEIANVLGLEGVKYMIEEAEKTPLKINFGAPSCVPATIFETAGAEITLEDIRVLFAEYNLKYLSEVMNYPGVIHKDPHVIAKIILAKEYNRVIDGHAPGVIGSDIQTYVNAGITTDHECFTYAEAAEKLSLGMKILIREGSAAKNFEALIDLLPQHFKDMMFCSDDKHPDDLEVGHIDEFVRRSISKGYDIMDILQVACKNPVEHYGLDVGLLRKGDFADFIVIDNPQNFNVQETWIDGVQVASWGSANFGYMESNVINNFHCTTKRVEDIKYEFTGKKLNVIEALDGQLITNKLSIDITNETQSSLATKDILKIVVVNRYSDAPVSTGFIKNFGLNKGSIASSVAHDSHNIVAVGVDDESIIKAVNGIIESKGGLGVYDGEHNHILPLPIAGLMTPENGNVVADQYTLLNKKVKEMGSGLSSPFMTLSFMALLVIPSLKMSDKGLFDGSKFEFVDLMEPQS